MATAKTIFKTFLWAVYLTCPLGLMGQELPPVTELAEVEIVDSRISEYAVGATTTRLDSTVLAQSQATSLAELLNDHTTTHIKSYGNGMLSSISFRGTGPEHTAVLWHGVNISYPMLGQTDFSLLPMALYDKLLIQHGTGSSLYGSGALGGTIALEAGRPQSGTSFGINQWAGSFGTLGNRVNVAHATDRYFIKVNTSWDRAENNFAFRNTSKPGAPDEIQENAAYDQLAFGLESGFKISKNGELLVSAQYLDMDRELQPSINVGQSDDFQNDNNFRLRARYSVNGKNSNGYVQYAYLADRINFNGAITAAAQHVVRGSFEHRFSDKIKSTVAFDQTMVGVRAEFYTGEAVSESRTNIWGSILALPTSWLTLSVNLRQAFHPIYKAPLSPSLGADIILLEGKAARHRVSLLASRGFRIPTLNELYWNPGGNPALIPEDSYSTELGFNGELGRQNRFSYQLTGYRMWVTNWILWRPEGNVWSPDNIREVDVYGLELSTTFDHKLGAARLRWQGNYALTRSINQTGLDQFDRSVGKQLSYTPIHKGGITTSLQHKTWSVLVNGVAIGERFTTADNENSLPAYFLMNLKASKSIPLGRYSLGLSASINNLFDISYQSVENRAMPGINYLLSLNLNYFKPN